MAPVVTANILLIILAFTALQCSGEQQANPAESFQQTPQAHQRPTEKAPNEANSQGDKRPAKWDIYWPSIGGSRCCCLHRAQHSERHTPTNRNRWIEC